MEKEAAAYRTQNRTQCRAHGGIRQILAPLGARRNVSRHGLRQGKGPATSGTLQASEDQQGIIVILQREAGIRAQV